jgi:hypothetical protein
MDPFTHRTTAYVADLLICSNLARQRHKVLPVSKLNHVPSHRLFLASSRFQPSLVLFDPNFLSASDVDHCGPYCQHL